jgi:hypothetical protein
MHATPTPLSVPSLEPLAARTQAVVDRTAQCRTNGRARDARFGACANGAHPAPHLRRDWARSLPPHLHRDWAHPSHICAGTGL